MTSKLYKVTDAGKVIPIATTNIEIINTISTNSNESSTFQVYRVASSLDKKSKKFQKTLSKFKGNRLILKLFNSNSSNNSNTLNSSYQTLVRKCMDNANIRHLAQDFNENAGYNKEIIFPKTLLIEYSSLSTSRDSKSQWGLLEPQISGYDDNQREFVDWETFIGPSGEIDPGSNQTMEAFSEYTYNESDKKWIVFNLQGFKTDYEYRLSNPQIVTVKNNESEIQRYLQQMVPLESNEDSDHSEEENEDDDNSKDPFSSDQYSDSDY